MRKYVKNPKNLLAGLMFLAIGLFAAVVSREYMMGTANRMGPGYFPTVLSWLLIGFGVAIAGQSFFGTPQKMESMAVAPAVYILLGSLLFGLLLRPAGLYVAIICMVAVGSLASPDTRLGSVVATAATLSIGSALIFVYLLGQPLPLIGYWFD